MSKEPEPTNPLDPFDTLNIMREASLKTWQAMRDASLETWSKVMIDFVNSDAYSRATAQWLATYLTISQPFQRALETTLTQTLARLNMPTRAEVTSLAERMTNIEMRWTIWTQSLTKSCEQYRSKPIRAVHQKHRLKQRRIINGYSILSAYPARA